MTLIEGRVRFADAHTVVIGGKRITADKILIATGGHPVRLPGFDEQNSITSNEAFYLEKLPERIAIVGGGYIAVEFAGIFNGLGSQVSLLYRGEQILRGFDDDLRHGLAMELTRKGIDLGLHAVVHRIEPAGNGWRLHFGDGATLEVDKVMAATGRRPNTGDLDAGLAGVELDHHGAVVVDAYSKTSRENIYAIGDVTDRLNLTPVAIREAMAFADTVFGGRPWAMDHDGVASAVFSQPPIGTVGLTEAEARRRHGEIDVYKAGFRPMKHTLSGRQERTLMKLVVETGEPAGPGRPYAGARCAGDHPGHGDRREAGRHQAAVRRGGGDPSDGGGGVRDHAHARARSVRRRAGALIWRRSSPSFAEHVSGGAMIVEGNMPGAGRRSARRGASGRSL